jgi:hypothetical protein
MRLLCAQQPESLRLQNRSIVYRRFFIETIEPEILAVAFCDSLEKLNGPWDIANRLGG